MENIQIILSITATAVGLLVTTATFIVKFILAVKSKNASEAARLVSEATQLLDVGVKKAVAFVETVKSKVNGELDGKTKLTIALTEINQFCIENGIVYNKEEAIAKIEELIKLTKEVNARDKDKIAAV